MQKNSDQLVSLDSPGLSPGSRTSLFGLDAGALAAVLASVDEPSWRSRQLAEAIYRQWIRDIYQITTLPKVLRERLVAKEFRALNQPRPPKIEP